ncbi:MAG: 2-hydroxychromene-2-carboxylate isomerase [Polymorphobacter sp.]
MTLDYDLFWSFRSPYSYLVTSRLVAMERDYDVRCNLRVVYPIAVRQPEFFDNSDPLWFSYLAKDTYRTAAFLGLPFHWPRPDPVVMDFATRKYPREQPYIHRLTRLGQAATEAGKGLAFIDEVSKVIWDGSVIGWHEGEQLAAAAARAGLDLAELDAVVAQDAQRLDSVIEAAQVAQREAGHYGVPMMAVDGEPFFGQDRFDQLLWRLQQKGLQKRR